MKASISPRATSASTPQQVVLPSRRLAVGRARHVRACWRKDMLPDPSAETATRLPSSRGASDAVGAEQLEASDVNAGEHVNCSPASTRVTRDGTGVMLKLSLAPSDGVDAIDAGGLFTACSWVKPSP